MTRDCLVHTFGVLLAGLFKAEKEAVAARPSGERRRKPSGVYPRPKTEPPPELSEPPPAF